MWINRRLSPAWAHLVEKQWFITRLHFWEVRFPNLLTVTTPTRTLPSNNIYRLIFKRYFWYFFSSFTMTTSLQTHLEFINLPPTSYHHLFQIFVHCIPLHIGRDYAHYHEENLFKGTKNQEKYSPRPNIICLMCKISISCCRELCSVSFWWNIHIADWT